MTWCLLLALGALLVGLAGGAIAGVMWIAVKNTSGGR